MPLTQYTYLFAVGTIFAALDAYNIGANDVANSFATSVSSRSLTMWQACVAASIFEFLGAVTVGARVSSTIKNSIVPLSIFQNNAGVGLLAFTVAIMCSASWLMLATRMSWPVSTTYSIISAVTGVGIAVGGINAPSWGWNDSKGIGAILAGLVIAPALAAAFGAALYMLIKLVVLRRPADQQVMWALWCTPFLFWLVGSVCTMSIIYKGAPNLGLNKLSKTTFNLAVVLTGLVLAILCALFWVPYVHAKVVKKDYTIRFWHFFLGPMLWFRAPPADAGAEGRKHVTDYRMRDRDDEVKPSDASTGESQNEVPDEKRISDEEIQQQGAHNAQLASMEEPPSLVQSWKTAILAAYTGIVNVFKHGVFYDIHAHTNDPASLKAQTYAKQYANETEACFSFVQVFTACVNSFAHGANDISNAVGPYSAIYAIWSTAQPLAKNSDTPVWILAAAAGFLVLGLATYGYNIMKVLGTKITLISPSRGSSMELGSAITVILASQYGIPVSTTMCITGALLGVGLCNGDVRAINWRSVGWIYIGWIGTMVVVALISYCIMAFILSAPHFA